MIIILKLKTCTLKEKILIIKNVMHTAKSEFYTIYDLVEMCLGEIDNEFEKDSKIK